MALIGAPPADRVLMKLSALWLKLRVHRDALHAQPGAYSVALWWRLRGKRLRARSQFARLFGVSPRAYQLWLLQQGEREEAQAGHSPAPPIIALVDASSGSSGLDETLRSLAAERLQAHVIDGQGTRLADVARAIDWTGEPWLMPVAAGDILARGAAAVYADAAAKSQARVIYADDDLRHGRTGRRKPHFKPDWNSELFRNFDYISGACIVRASADTVLAVANPRDWAAGLVATAIEGEVPLHIRQVLHHRRHRPSPRVPVLPATAVTRSAPVSVIVPTRNRVDLLRTCLEGLARTDYADMEVLVADNDSDDPETLLFLASLEQRQESNVRVVRVPGPFNFSAINNRAVALARGRLLCLLNNDIEMLDPHWLTIMVQQALRDDVGAVGAKLLYPDRRIQHAGVVLGMGGAAGHAHRLLKEGAEGYFRRHELPQFVSAVTAACLVVQRDRFDAVGGLDEEKFPVAFNDVDLCLRLNQRGWQTLYEPRATLIHHESVSRGFDRDPVGAARLARELEALKTRWGTATLVDPFHHPELSRFSEQFVVGL
jgi:GT2 family glycosyltransferase